MERYKFILLILILILITTFFLYKQFNLEQFIAPINNIDIPFEDDENPYILNTPLTPLKSKILIYPEIETPNFLCYNPKKLVSPVNQGQFCGSCWAIIISEIISDRIITKYNGSLKIRFSAQQLLDCYNYPNGCNGQSPEDALIWLIKNKSILTTENNIPYQQMYTNVITTNKNSCSIKSGIQLENNSLYSITTFIDDNESKIGVKNKEDSIKLLKNIENMKRDLLLRGPFFATISIYNDLYNFTENEPYVNKSDVFIGGHAIEIVGYCEPGVDKRNGYIDGYWICKNSWGLDWPKNPIYPGYFTIKMGLNVCGIESRCCGVDPLPEKKQININNVAFTDFNTFDDVMNNYAI